MLFHIMIVVFGLIAIAAGVFSWKLENGSFGEEEDINGTLETVSDQGKDEEDEREAQKLYLCWVDWHYFCMECR